MSWPTAVYRARVEMVNGHRLTYRDAAANPEMTAWRVISSRREYSRWAFLFDDYVLDANLPAYIVVAAERGAERISVHRLGSVREALAKERMHMKGTESLASVEKIAKLESFIEVPVRKKRKGRTGRAPTYHREKNFANRAVRCRSCERRLVSNDSQEKGLCGSCARKVREGGNDGR